MGVGKGLIDIRQIVESRGLFDDLPQDDVAKIAISTSIAWVEIEACGC